MSIIATRQIKAPADRVFAAWIDPAIARKFLFATPEGKMVRVEIDARPGGSFRITEKRDGEDVDHIGTYERVEPPGTLIFTFGVPKYSPDMTRVTLAIEPTTTGSKLTLTHEGVPAEWRERTKQGWTMILESLAAAVEQVR